MRFRGVLLGVAVAACSALACAQAASAATFNVTDPSDAALSTATDTNCASTNSGSCTLRAAVQAADNTGGSNTINLPAGDYKLTIPPSCASYSSSTVSSLDGCDANDPTQGDLDVLSGDTLTINGAGSGTTTVDAAGIDRAFAVAMGASLTLSGMTIEDGTPAAQTCTYIYSPPYSYNYTCFPSDVPNAGPGNSGGGVYSDGALSTRADVVFYGDQAQASNSGGDGGAIYADTDSTGLSLAGATFKGNFATDGSAIYDDAPVAATITGATFTGNDNSGGEGTIYGSDGIFAATPTGLDVTGSTFTDNTSGSGGVFYWRSEASLSAENSTFSGNSATSGGVIDNEYLNHATSFTGDVFTGNTAYEAGVIFQDDSYSASGTTVDSVTFNGDEVDSNRATYEGVGNFSQGAGLTSSTSSYIGNSGAYGGAFDFASSGDTALTNVTMSSNTSNYGGAIYLAGGTGSTETLDLTNDTIAFNTATAAAGGIYGAQYAVASSASGGVRNTIVAENTGGDCTGGAFVAAGDAGYNLDSDSSCFGYAGAPASDHAGVNPLLSQPAANGGPNQVLTDAERSTSPSVDAGTNTGCASTDERGLPRPATASDPCDIGAFELLGAPLHATTSAPGTGGVGQPFAVAFNITADATGGPSTGTALGTRLPAGETLYGTTTSQGSCQSSGTPATVVCQLGTLAPGATATVQLVVADAIPGAVTNIASASNDEGDVHTTSAITLVAAPSTPPPTVYVYPPTAITEPAGGITTTGATLSGLVNPGGQPTAFFFQFGTDTTYGAVSSIGHTGSTDTAVSAALAGLTPNTTYHYRVVAINDSGTSYGSDTTFTTGSTYRGAIRLARKMVSVKAGKALIALKCTSASACRGRVMIITSLEQPGHAPHNVTCAKQQYKVAGRHRKTIKAPIAAACRSVLTSQGHLVTNLTLHPTTPQAPLIERATLIL